MEYLDARRLTGPNLLWDLPGSILDVRCAPEEARQVIDTWSAAVRRMLDAVGWQDESLCVHELTGGVSLAFSAPIDALYSATEINEWAWSVLEAGSGAPDDEALRAKAAEIRDAIDEECNPPLLELRAAADAAGVAFLWDDDDVSIGHGCGSATWPFRELPAANSLDWSRFHDVPVGIVTGTNGKTTTVRVATHLARTAGRRTGVSCTDWIAVDDEIIDRGDWSGPGGARNVLRQQNVELAILETARGGLLRRGLGVERADAALITNVAEDHLGDFGSQTLDELLDIKWVVSRAVRSDGVLILNADDERLVAKAADYPGAIQWFSIRAGNPVVEGHLGSGGTSWYLDGDDLVRAEGGRRDRLCAARDVPITLDGAARHNVANALSASALTAALGVPLDAIVDGLKSMDQTANPGRSNLFEVNGATFIVDFAHNPHAMQALFDMASAIPANRRLLAFGQAGDRTDRQIRELARCAWAIGLDQVAVSELAKYHRGRSHGEVFGLIRDELIDSGADTTQVHHFEEEIEALDYALEWARSGDLVLFLALASGQAICDRLASASRSTRNRTEH